MTNSTVISKKYYNSDVEIDLSSKQFLSIKAGYNEYNKNIEISFHTMDICEKTNTVSTMFFGESIHRTFKIKQLTRKNSKLVLKAKEELLKINTSILLDIFNSNNKELIKQLIVL